MNNDNDSKFNKAEAIAKEKLSLLSAEKTGTVNTSNPNNSEKDDIKDKEESTTLSSFKNNVKGLNQLNKPGGLATFMSGLIKGDKSKWPIWVATLITLGGGIGLLTLLSPSLFIIHVKESLTQALDSSSPALHLRTNKLLANKFKSIKYSFSESSNGKCNIKCKFYSISNETLDKLKTQGFEVETEKGILNRHIITSMTFPDTDGNRVTVKNSVEFNKAIKVTANAVNLAKVFNSKSAFFTNSIFSSMLRKKFDVDKTFDLTSKAADEESGKTTTAKERALAAIRKKLKLPDIDIKAKKLTLEEKIKSNPKYKSVINFKDSVSIKAVDKANNVLSMVCAGYNVSKGVTYVSTASRIATFAGIAMLVMGTSDKLKSGDEIDPVVLDMVGTMLTEKDENGNTATSSNGYRSAAYGESVTLTKEDEKYSLTSSGEVTSLLGSFSTAIGLSGTVATKAFRTACRGAGNVVVDVATTCPNELLAAFATAGETFGVGAGVSALVCIGKMVALDAAIGTAIGTVISTIIPAVVSTELPNVDENIIGTAAGDSVSNGVAQVLGSKAATYGLTAGNAKQIEQYQKDVVAIRQEQEDIARYEAKDTPFDISNQYSFLGSIAKTMNFSALFNTSLTFHISNLLSFIPKAFASIVNSTDVEALTKAELYSKCKNGNLASIGVSGDAFCNPYYFMGTPELNADINATREHMEDKKYISKDTGEAIKDDKGKDTDYQKYLDNCANRVDPLGETSAAIEDDDYYWKTGRYCTITPESSDLLPAEIELAKELIYFHTYTMDKAVQDTIDNNKKSETADANIDFDHLYEDSSNIKCATGTTDNGIQDGYKENNKISIRTCSIPGTLDRDENLSSPREMIVNSRVSGAWLALINDMRSKLGIDTIQIGSSFRTMDMQKADKGRYGSEAAEPGFSLHQMGLAVDFGPLYSSGVSSWPKGEKAYYDYLSWDGNGAKFHMAQFPSEAWHWQPKQ
ncbi:MAG: hypothetical protein PWQ10_671 [Patescibacteria group bacterium]|nr:hypothetical protein [Patescibacteria group bacterium]